MRICNNPKHRFIFDQKPEFDKMFNEFCVVLGFTQKMQPGKCFVNL